MLFDVKGRKGSIYQKLIYGKRKQTETHRAVNSDKRARLQSNNDNDDEHETDNGEDQVTEEAAFVRAANALISFIESCKVPQDLNKIKQKFEETIKLRCKMSMALDDYEQLFNLYLVCPSLVLIDFRLQFPFIDSTALNSAWPKIQKMSFVFWVKME